MNIGYLKEFLVLADCENFTKAASSLYISQPALSKHIASLEQQLQCDLFERKGKSVELTPLGCAFKKEAARVVRAFDDAMGVMAELRTKEPMSIRVLLFESYKPVRDLVRSVSRDLQSRFPLFEISQIFVTELAPIAELDRGSVDVYLGMSRQQIDRDDLHFTPLFAEPEAVVVKNDHPFARRSSIQISDLKDQLIHMPASFARSEMKEHATDMLREFGIEPRYALFEDTDANDIFDFTFDEGLLMAPISCILHNACLNTFRDYSVIRVDDANSHIWSYALYREDNENKALKVFEKALVEYASEEDFETYWQYLPTF